MVPMERTLAKFSTQFSNTPIQSFLFCTCGACNTFLAKPKPVRHLRGYLWGDTGVISSPHLLPCAVESLFKRGVHLCALVIRRVFLTMTSRPHLAQRASGFMARNEIVYFEPC